MEYSVLKLVTEQVINETILHNWLFWLTLLAFTLISSALSSFAVSFYKKKAETKAARADHAEIISMLKEQTNETEKIKSAISHEEWTLKEYKLLKREKLEALAISADEMKMFVFYRFDVLLNRKDSSQPSPVMKFNMLYQLYFPDLNDSCYDLSTCYSDILLLINSFSTDDLKYKERLSEERVQFMVECQAKFKKKLEIFNVKRLDFEEAASLLMQNLIKVSK